MADLANYEGSRGLTKVATIGAGVTAVTADLSTFEAFSYTTTDSNLAVTLASPDPQTPKFRRFTVKVLNDAGGARVLTFVAGTGVTTIHTITAVGTNAASKHTYVEFVTFDGGVNVFQVTNNTGVT